jgi:hypothetical protein
MNTLRLAGPGLPRDWRSRHLATGQQLLPFWNALDQYTVRAPLSQGEPIGRGCIGRGCTEACLDARIAVVRGE